MATTADADLILKMYELRREELMRKARAFVVFDFNPKSAEELLLVQRGAGSEHNAYWRQVLSYWEMAASFVLRGAVDAELFLDSGGEGIFIYAKFAEDYKNATGKPFMVQTAAMIERFPVAKERYEGLIRARAPRVAAEAKL